MKITSFGEVLWDDFPSGKKLGGAPLNVVTRLRALGVDTAIISRIGDDEDGRGILKEVEERNVPQALIQTDPEQATSLVSVTLSSSGSASYEIVYPCAWDRIEATQEACERVAQSDAFVFGSLATRDEVSRAALEKLLEHARFKIFDVNLRPPHYDYERLRHFLQKADVVKLNDDELYELTNAFGSPYHSLEQNAAFLANHVGCNKLCITMGEHGAMFYDKEGAGKNDNLQQGWLSVFYNPTKPLTFGAEYVYGERAVDKYSTAAKSDPLDRVGRDSRIGVMAKYDF